MADSERHIDLNCDMGESFGAYRVGDDEQLLRFVTSANLACGFHAGDPGIMRRTVELCVAHGVAIGAHPGLPDLQGFGRREMAVAADDAYAMTLYQIGALHAFVQAAGARLAHVKPHGALYHMAAADAELAAAFCRAVRDFDPGLIVVGPPGGQLAPACRAAGLGFAVEGFVDRAYRGDGTLAPRTEPGAVLAAPDAAAAQAVALAVRGAVATPDGATYAFRPRTLCVHGDSPGAAELAARVRAELAGAGVAVRALSREAL